MAGIKDSAQEQKDLATKAPNTLPEVGKPEVAPIGKKSEEETKPAPVLDPSKTEQISIYTMDPDELKKLEERSLTTPETPAAGESEQQKKDAEKAAATAAAAAAPDPREKIIADQRAEITRLQQQRAQQAREKEEAEWVGYKKPTEEDLDVLYDEDREAYDLAVDKVKRHDEYLNTKAHSEVENAYNDNKNAVFGFLAAQKKVELNDATRAELMKTLENKDSEETKLILEMDDYLQKNFAPIKRVAIGKNDKGNVQYLPVYSQEQITNAYNLLHFNDIIKSREETIQAQTLEKIKKAGVGGSAFDRMEPPGPGDITAKKPEDFTQAEVLNMSEEQLGHVAKMFNP